MKNLNFNKKRNLQEYWQEHLLYKIHFYKSNKVRNRDDSGYNWQLDYAHNASKSILSKLKQLRPYSTFRQHLKAKKYFKRNLDWLNMNANSLYHVRQSLTDEFSKLLYDETIVLRVLGFEKFIGPRVGYEKEYIKVINEKAFSHPELPDNYLSADLKEYTIHLQLGDSSIPVNIIAIDNFDALTNIYCQYFLNRYPISFIPNAGDIIFDCGACIGEVTTMYAALVGEHGAVHAFDPMALHIKFCELQSKNNPTISHVYHMNPFAVSDRSILRSAQNMSDQITPGLRANEEFSTISLDSYVEENAISKVDLIKMDIEGSELAALRGAEKILKHFKPKLAISIYHSPEEFYKIPQIIKEINPDYQFMFGHHSPTIGESIIYAY